MERYVITPHTGIWGEEGGFATPFSPLPEFQAVIAEEVRLKQSAISSVFHTATNNKNPPGNAILPINRNRLYAINWLDVDRTYNKSNLWPANQSSMIKYTKPWNFLCLCQNFVPFWNFYDVNQDLWFFDKHLFLSILT